MKLLLDQNISYRLLDKLDATYPGSAQVRLAGMAAASDAPLWQYAKENGFVIVTKDSDFHELGLVRGFPPKVIWLQCGNTSTQYVLNILLINHKAVQNFIKDTENACLELY